MTWLTPTDATIAGLSATRTDGGRTGISIVMGVIVEDGRLGAVA